jgi:hypothetical protein
MLRPSIHQFAECIPLFGLIDETIRSCGVKKLKETCPGKHEDTSEIIYESTGEKLKLLWSMGFDILDDTPESGHAWINVRLSTVDELQNDLAEIVYDPTDQTCSVSLDTSFIAEHEDMLRPFVLADRTFTTPTNLDLIRSLAYIFLNEEPKVA